MNNETLNINNEVPENLKKPESLAHLAEGESPIMACIGSRWDFSKEPGLADNLGYWGEGKPNTLLVDYFGEPYDYMMKDILNAGSKTFGISAISEENKFSLKYRNCTGVVATGKDKTTGKNISFFTHQDTMKVLPDGSIKLRFEEGLKSRLNELKSRCVPGTVDAVIFGGNYLDSEKYEKEHLEHVEFEKNYQDSVSSLSAMIKNSLGFEPTVIAGPKTGHGEDDVIYDNENRRLYIRRPDTDITSPESFLPSEMDEQDKRLREERK